MCPACLALDGTALAGIRRKTDGLQSPDLQRDVLEATGVAAVDVYHGRNLRHLVNTVQDLPARGVGLRVLAGDGTQVDTTIATDRLGSTSWPLLPRSLQPTSSCARRRP